MKSVMIGGIREWQKTSRGQVIGVAQAWLGNKPWVRDRVNDLLDKAVSSGELHEDDGGVLALPHGQSAYTFHIELSDQEAAECQNDP